MRRERQQGWERADERQLSMILGGLRVDPPQLRDPYEPTDALVGATLPEPSIARQGYGRDPLVAWWDTWSS
jgi:hypothetical protein